MASHQFGAALAARKVHQRVDTTCRYPVESSRVFPPQRAAPGCHCCEIKLWKLDLHDAD